MGLAGAGVADRDDVLPAGYILRAGELQNENLVERRNGGEVEAVHALHGREPRLLDPPLDHPPFAVDQLQFGQAQQKTDMIEALGGALPSELVVLAQERRQLERLQVMGKQKLGRIGHDAVPVSRPMYVLADVIATWACGRYGSTGMSRRGGRRSIRHSTRCFTASKPIAPRAMASRTAAATSSARNTSISRRTCTNSRLPCLPIRASIIRRSVANSSGSRQPANGAA